jgi:hypothetical protein
MTGLGPSLGVLGALARGNLFRRLTETEIRTTRKTLNQIYLEEESVQTPCSRRTEPGGCPGTPSLQAVWLECVGAAPEQESHHVCVPETTRLCGEGLHEVWYQ